MPVYVIADIEVLDATLFEVPPEGARHHRRHGGRYLARVGRRRCWRGVTGRPGAA